MAGTTLNAVRNQYEESVDGGMISSASFYRTVDDFIDRTHRQDVVLTKKIGSSPAPKKPTLKVEWGWGNTDPYLSRLAANITNADQTTILVEDGSFFQIAERIKINTEQMYVIGIEGDTIQVRRGQFDTSAVTHDIDSQIVLMGSALVEAADDPDSPFTMGSFDYNYCQIMDFTWTLSNRADEASNYEHPNGGAFKSELKKKMNDTAPLRMELTYLLGGRQLGSANSPSGMGGLEQASFVSTRVGMNGEPLTEKAIRELAGAVHQIAGTKEMPTSIMTSHFGLEVISSWYNETRRSTMKDEKANLVWYEIQTAFGLLKIFPNYLMNDVAKNTLYLFDPSELKRQPFSSRTGWQTGVYEVPGWYKRGFLRCDQTLKAQGADWRGALTGWSTNDADYAGL